MSGKLVSQVLELDLPQHEKFVAVTLASFGWEDGSHIYPGVPQLARLTGYTDRRVQQILRSLEDKGIIVAVAYTQGGRGKSTEYQMHVEKGEILPPVKEKGEKGEKGETQERVKSETQRVKKSAQRVKNKHVKGETIVSPQHKNLREPGREPEEFSDAVASPPPPANPPPQPSVKEPTSQQAEVGAWAAVMGLDVGIPANAARVGNMLKGLRRSKVAQPSVDVAALYWTHDGRADWNYYRDTWQGQKGQPPTEREITTYWGAWLHPAPYANGNGHQARDAPTKQERTLAALDEYLAEQGYEPPPVVPGVIEGRVIRGNTS